MTYKDYSAMTNEELIAEAGKRLAMSDFWESLAKDQLQVEPDKFRDKIIRNLELLDRHCL